MKNFFLPFLFMMLLVQTSSAQQETNTLPAGTQLSEGQRLVSNSNQYCLFMQSDGNLCVKTCAEKQFMWCSMVHVGSGCYLSMQTDGNLAVYDRNHQMLWNTMTTAFYDDKYASVEWKPVRAVIEENGTLSLYSATGNKVWTHTDKHEQPIVSPGIGYTGKTVKKNLNVRLPGSDKDEDVIVEVNERGEVFYNGDVHLGKLDDLISQSKKPKSSFDGQSFMWPNSTVPYVLPANHPRKEYIEEGIDFLNAHTTVCLVPRTNQLDYVEFITRDGNWSALGRVGGRQEISIENQDMMTVIHEIMHALGFEHIQCREDRDQYVTINFENIENKQEHNFRKSTNKQSNLGAYDFTSCMHYSSNAFARRTGLKTIVRKDGKTEEMGREDSMSVTDIANIAAVYPLCPYKDMISPIIKIPGCDANDAQLRYQKTMTPGNNLLENQKLVSSNGLFQLRGAWDGNFVIEEILNDGKCPYREIYRFPLQRGGKSTKVSELTFGNDGNICINTRKSKTYCLTKGGEDSIGKIILHKVAFLELTDDGRLRLVDKNNQELWATSPSNESSVTTSVAICDAIDAIETYKTRMEPGNLLYENEKMVSSNGLFQFRGTPDGEFVIEEILDNGDCPYKVRYRFPLSSGAFGGIPERSFFSYGSDGNMCIISRQNKNYCATHGSDATGYILHKSAFLELTDDGRLRLINSDGNEIWATSPASINPNTSTAPASNPVICDANNAEERYRTVMTPGNFLYENEKLISENGRFQFRATADGNFVIEEILNSNDCQYKQMYKFPLKNGVPGSLPVKSYFIYGKDGNLCIKSKQNKSYCASYGFDATDYILHSSVSLELTNDGRLRLMDSNGNEIWATAPAPKNPLPTSPVAPVVAICDARNAVNRNMSVMPAGNFLYENEKMVSANGQYQFRVTPGGDFVIEEILNSGDCPYKEKFRFPLDKNFVIANLPKQNLLKFGIDGNICVNSSKQGKSFCLSHGGDANSVLLHKSISLELTDDGRLRLLDSNGNEIWTTTR